MEMSHTHEQRATARALLGGAPPTVGRLAVLLGSPTGTLAEWASEGGWAVLDFSRNEVRDCYERLREATGEPFDDGQGASLNEPPPPVPPSAAQDIDADEAGVLAATLRDVFLKQCKRIARRMTRGDEPLGKSQIEVINALTRLADKLDSLARIDAVARQNERDEDVAEFLERINERVLFLAERLAEEIVSGTRMGLATQSNSGGD